MPFRLADLIAARPYVYHLTSQENLARIRRAGCLESAAALLQRAGRTDLLQARRRGPVVVEVDGEKVLLRDQDPLYEGNILFEGGWTLPRLIEHLNSKVFFWPGDETGPIPHGERHRERYRAENPTIIRVGLQALIDANPGAVPHLCRRNSGSPRTVAGKKSPRGPQTFVPCDRYQGGVRSVVEVTFEGTVALPPETETRLITDKCWSPFLPVGTK